MMGFEVNQDGERQQYYVQLLQWLQYNVTQSWISSKVKISPSKISGSSFMSGYGVFSTGAISEGELLFVIPSDGCISFSSSIMNDDFGERLRLRLKGAGPGGSTVGLAGWLAKERLKLILDHQTHVSFQPYLSILPWYKEEQDHVLFYSDQQIQSLSQLYPQAAEDAKGLRLEVEIAKKLLCPIILDFLIGCKDTSLSHYKHCKELCHEAITAAFVIVLTRSFYSNDIQEERLVPLLDMLQHNDTPTIRHESDVKGNVYVYARYNIDEGQEIYNQYAAKDSMESYQWLTRFGFLPDGE
jgi:hypothetical protein